MRGSLRDKDRGGGKVGVVTGGAVRVGRAICTALAEAGFRVAIHYNSSAREAEELAKTLDPTGDGVQVFGRDLLSPGACEGLLREVLSFWGRLDLWVNNAALFCPDGAPSERIAAMKRLNCRVPEEIGAAARESLAETRGSFVNIADVLAQTATKKHKIYAETKRDLLSFTASFARENAGTGIRANAVAPGLILPSAKDEHAISALVEKVPMRRLGNPSDVGAAVAYLATADYVTGQTIFVDGGRHLEPA